jgi:uncharacterized protein YaiE (UPF0345 family)
MKKNFKFSDLFDGDLANASFAKNERAKVSVGQLENLEKIFPGARFNK